MKHIALFTLAILTLLFITQANTTSAAQNEQRRAVSGTTFIVNNIGDAGDANTNDEICETSPGNGVCTLRAAIQEADADNDHDIIQFGFTTPVTIKPLNALPEFDTPITFDGVTGNPSTCPSGTTPANLLVTLSGEDIDPDTQPSGLTMRADADNSVIRGLTITDFRNGIFVRRNASGFIFQSNLNSDIICNHIHDNSRSGIRLDGAGSMRIGIEGDSSSRNVISDNRNGIDSTNVWASNGGSLHIAENYVGTTPNGTGDDGNRDVGIWLQISEPGTTRVVNNISAFNGEHGVYFRAAPPLGGTPGSYIIESNTIFSNGLNGVRVNTDPNGDGDTANLLTVERNAIYDNDQLGIDNGMVGTDTESAGSDRNRARLLSVGDNGGTYELRLAFISLGNGASYKINLYHNDTCDPSGFGEGQIWAEQFTIAPNSTELFLTQAMTVPLPAGKFISALVTNPDGETSEFSNCIAEVTTFVVNRQSDTDDALINGVCADSGGLCSLRAAIQEINAATGSEPKVINFDLTGNIRALRLSQGPLPTITKPIYIEGDSHAHTRCQGENSDLRMGIFITPLASNDTPYWTSGSGIVLGAGSDGSTVNGFWVKDMPDHGVEMLSSSNTLSCSFIDTCGDDCVLVTGNNNTVGGPELFKRNLIEESDETGIKIQGTAGFNRVQSNVIQNNSVGVYLRATASDNNVGASGILTSNDAFELAGYNYIVDNVNGVRVDGTGTNNNIGGNYVGVQPDGSNGSNNQIGIWTQQNGVTVGGTRGFANIFFAAPNIIGYNQQGVLAEGDNGAVSNNFVGVGETGSSDLGNAIQGINITGDGVTVMSNTVGFNSVGIEMSGESGVIKSNYVGVTISPTLSVGNVNGIVVSGDRAELRDNVVGNSSIDGVFVTGEFNDFYSNWIGITPDGVDIGNGGVGINMLGSPNTIGDTADSDVRNAIELNGSHGVAIGSGQSLVTVINADIRKNGGNGIDVNNTANDNYFRGLAMSGNMGKAIDINAGNDGMSTVFVVSADSDTNLIEISFQGAPNTLHFLEFYRSDNCSGASSGIGEEAIKTRFAFVTTNDGKPPVLTYDVDDAFASGNGITALISNSIANTAPGSTAEFGSCAVATGTVPTAVGLGVVSAETSPSLPHVTALLAVLLASVSAYCCKRGSAPHLLILLRAFEK